MYFMVRFSHVGDSLAATDVKVEQFILGICFVFIVAVLDVEE